MTRASNVTPLHRGVPPMPNLVSLTRDYGSAHIIDLNQHRVSREYIRQCEELDAQCRDLPPLRETRHVRIEPRIDWPTVLAWWALALSLGCIVYFGGQLLRGVL